MSNKHWNKESENTVLTYGDGYAVFTIAEQKSIDGFNLFTELLKLVGPAGYAMYNSEEDAPTEQEIEDRLAGKAPVKKKTNMEDMFEKLLTKVDINNFNNLFILYVVPNLTCTINGEKQSLRDENGELRIDEIFKGNNQVYLEVFVSAIKKYMTPFMSGLIGALSADQEGTR